MEILVDTLEGRMVARLEYDLESGIIRWTNDQRNKFPGKQAGCEGAYRYWIIVFENKIYRRSRVAWLLVKGHWPKEDIDHKNGKVADDRWANLRPATDSENMCNMSTRIDNTSGARGVSWNLRLGKWHVRVNVERQMHHIGYFDDFDKAVRARDEAALKLHGEFARLNNPLMQGT